MRHYKERRGLIHRGVRGWHHHHTGNGSILFHDYDNKETVQEPPEGMAAPGDEGETYLITFHTHDVSHDLEFSSADDDEKPCGDPDCPWLGPVKV